MIPELRARGGSKSRRNRLVDGEGRAEMPAMSLLLLLLLLLEGMSE